MNGQRSQHGQDEESRTGRDESPGGAWIEALLARSARSAARPGDVHLAAAEPCPRPEELAALSARRLPGPDAERLARHLVACPRCLDAGLAVLVGLDEGATPSPGARVAEVAPEPGAVPGRGRRLGRAASLAAALAAGLLLWVLGTGGPESPGLAGLRPVGPAGLELRAGEAPAARRVLAEVARDGWIALVVVPDDGDVLAVETGGDPWIAVEAGEEVLLPLDGPVVAGGPQTWRVLHTDRRPDEAPPDAAGGGRGLTALEVRFR